MSRIRPTLSKRNRYHISRHKFYELRHFCLQYPEWRKELLKLTPISSPKFSQGGKSDKLSDPTGDIAVRRHELVKLMEVVEQAARAADPELEPYILLAVTEDLSYTALSMTYKIPCGKDLYYDRYRKFFWVLSQRR